MIASCKLVCLHMVEEAVLQVLNMINLSSELFKIETGRFRLDAKKVDIGDILRRILDMARATIAHKGLSLSFTCDAPVEPSAYGDAMFCYSIFQNLIKNACEAAPRGGKVNVSVDDTVPLCITIENQGAVPAEIRDRFFLAATPAEPGKGVRRQPGGFGLTGAVIDFPGLRSPSDRLHRARTNQ